VGGEVGRFQRRGGELTHVYKPRDAVALGNGEWWGEGRIKKRRGSEKTENEEEGIWAG